MLPLPCSPDTAWQKYRKDFASQQQEVQEQSWQGPLDVLENFLEWTEAGRRTDLFSPALSRSWLFCFLLPALSPPQPFYLG